MLGLLLAFALPTAAGAGLIALRIEYHADATAPSRVFTLRCGPPAASVANPASACRRLVAIGARAFAPTPRGIGVCTQLYGGPATALVSGTYFGRPVWTRLGRKDGCQIARWDRVGFLLPPPSRQR